MTRAITTDRPSQARACAPATCASTWSERTRRARVASASERHEAEIPPSTERRTSRPARRAVSAERASEERPFVDAYGIEVFTRWWPVDEPRGLVLVSHGASEHCGRYDRFA